MTKVSVVFHSGFGHTKRLAEAVLEGVKTHPNAEAVLIDVDQITEADWKSLDESQAIIFGSPTYMGGVSAPFKKFIDDGSKRWFEQKWKDKIAAGFTNSASMSGDKFNTLVQLATNAMQHGMIWVGLGVLPPQNPSGDDSFEKKENRLGSFMGVMSQSNHTAGPDITPPDGDLATGMELGKRVAEIASKLVA